MRFPDDVPVLSDGVVTLRAHRGLDADRVVEQCADPASARWTFAPTPYTPDDARDFLEQRVPQGWTTGSAWWFAVEHGGRFVGSVDLRPHGAGEAEVGYGLHPDARGAAVMRRALHLLLDWAFTEQDVAVVNWRCFEGNWASRRVAWALGFTFGDTVPARVGRPDRWTGRLGRGDVREPVTPWWEPPVLERDGVRLRGWHEDDGPRLVEAAHDPVLLTGIPRAPLPRTEAEVAAYLLRVGLGAASGRRLPWCVADAGTDRALGGVAVVALGGGAGAGTGEGAGEVGYWSHPAGRGRGLMTTALELAVEHALSPTALDLRRLALLTAASNRASRRLAERVGFALVGIERASSPVAGGGWEDTAVYDRLR